MKKLFICIVVLLCVGLVFVGCDASLQNPEEKPVVETEQPEEPQTPEETSERQEPVREKPEVEFEDVPELGESTAAYNPDEPVSTDIATQEPAIAPMEPSQSVQLDASESTLTVNATETVKKMPDIAHVELGVRTQGLSAEDAQQQNAEKAETVLAALKLQGIAEDDIETSYVNLYQDYQDNTKYTMENTFRVTVRDIDAVGEVIDAAIKAGANTSYYMSFAIEDSDGAYIEALSKAMQSIAAKADAVAKAGGYSIVRPKSIEEGGSSGYYDMVPMAEEAAMDTAESGGGYTTPISPGEIEISASVTGTYVIA